MIAPAASDTRPEMTARPPLLIAHAAGNSEAAALAAITEAPDFIEVDLWAHNGHLEARHERAAYPLPFWFEKWYLKRAPREPYSLSALLATVRSHTGVLLDMKNGGDAVARVLCETIEAVPGVEVAASSQSWSSLRWIARYCPTVDLYYSVDVLPKLDLFLDVLQRDPLPKGVSCKHTLLDTDTVARLHDAGLLVLAWTVDDVDRARELVSMGVDGLTTHRVSAFREAFATP